MLSKKLEIKYYESIITTLNKNDMTYEWINDHYTKLLEDTIETENIVENKQVKTEESDSHEDLYKKPWNKLNSIHKILKIKEFINNLKNITDKEKVTLKEELVELVKSKVLTKKEKINYDENNGKIISLINLMYKDGKYVYLST